MSDARPRLENATFHCFKTSGKWYATARGHLPESTFDRYHLHRLQKRKAIVAANGQKYPGLNSDGSDLVFVVFADENVDYGFPLMLHPHEDAP